MNRRLQFLLIGSTLLASWLGMQVIHEMGHVLAAWCSGGKVERVVLCPWTISRTDLSSNPNPLVVVWGGPLFGSLMPIILGCVATSRKWPEAFLLRFFAGFCAIANGVYIGFGSIDQIGDAGDMLRHGAPLWTLWLFGIVTVPAGLLLWHRLGRHFGLGPTPDPISPRSAFGALSASLILFALGTIAGGQ